MEYDNLLKVAERCGLFVYETKFKSRAKGLTKGNIIGIADHLPLAEKSCILAEELGHYHTSTGNILDQSDIRNHKQELRARQWAYQKLIPLERIVDAHHARVKGRYDIAGYLGVTEEFLQSCIDRYTEKYGLYAPVGDRYIVYFDPLGVIELFPS